MQTVTNHIRRHLLDSLGVCDTPILPSLDELRELQRSTVFERLCSNRMVLGTFRYGLMRPGHGNGYDNVSSIIKRSQLYQETGNTEHLCDIANLAMIEFMTSQHPSRHFHAADDGIHTNSLDTTGRE